MDDDAIATGVWHQREFETQIGARLDALLAPYGFHASPQNGFAVDTNGRVVMGALYEADTDEYARRYPSLRSRFEGEVPCIDLWVTWNEAAGRLRCTLEGDELTALLAELGFEADLAAIRQTPADDVDAQLDAIAGALAALLDAAPRVPWRLWV